MRRRLFERLEQRVLRLLDQGVGLVDDHHAPPGLERPEVGLIDDARTVSILIEPESPGASRTTSGCTPRAMRRHDGHCPQPSRSSRSVVFGSVQLIAWASSSATRFLPTPAGPANSSAGGSVSRAIARDSRVTSRRWPTTCSRGIRDLRSWSLCVALVRPRSWPD
jgi:hypothetical protein